MAEREIVYVLSADDKASAVFKKVAGEADNTSGAIVSGAQKAEKAQASLTTASKELLVGFSGVATAAFSLYQAFDALEKAQYRVQKANVAVDSTTNSVNAAQKTYTDTVEKFGIASEESTQALNLLKTAEDRHALAVDAANLAQNNLNDTQTRAFLQIIPAGITMVAGLVTAWKGMRDIGPAVVGAFTNITGSINAAKAAFIGLGIAMAAILLAVTAINTSDNELRLALEVISSAVLAAAAAWWAFNAAAAIGLTMTGVGIAMVVAGAAAGVAMFALQEKMAGDARAQREADEKEREDYNRRIAEEQMAAGTYAAPTGLSTVNMPGESTEQRLLRQGFWRGENGAWTNMPTNIPAAAGGMEVTKPTLLMAGESGTELVLSPEQTKAYKSGAKMINNYYTTVQVQQTLDDDLIVEKVVREIRRRTGMNI